MDNASFVIKTSCRLCGGSFNEVLSLGNLVPSDFVTPDQPEPERVPLTLVECKQCSLVQLEHTMSREKLYRQYWYHSGINPTMVTALMDVARSVEERVELYNYDDVNVIIDIGANDGTLLATFPDTLYKVACEPAQNFIEALQKDCHLLISDFFERAEFELPQKAKAITSIAMFYDLDDPHRFVKRIAEVLHPEGVWIVQMMDLVRMLKARAVDNICHEHLCYYSVEVFKKLIGQHGLKLFDLEFNDVNGGSFRAYVCHKDQRRPIKPAVFEALEAEEGYLNPGLLVEFKTEIERARRDLLDFIHYNLKMGRKFHALGASTKGNTLLQFYGLTNEHIEYAAEVNLDKRGRRTAGSNIPIISEEESLVMKPDYYLVLPWAFLPFFLRKHADYLFNGGAMVTPLPKPTVHRYEQSAAQAPYTPYR